MNNNKTDLLCHLESHLVFKNGMIHQDDLNAADRKQLEMWDDKGFVKLEKIPLPDRHTGPVMYTHRIRFSDKAWELAHKFRRKIAQRTTPTLKSDNQSGLKLIKNGQEKSPRRDASNASNAEGDEDDPSTVPGLPSYDGFTNWIEQNKADLTIPQRRSAKMIFETMKVEGLTYFWRKKKTGKSWLLKSIDRYITQL